MDGKTQARAAALIVLTLAAGASVVLMFTLGGAFQPVWFWATAGGWVVALGASWYGAGALAGKRADADRFRMPVRPDLMAQAVGASRREGEPQRAVGMPRRETIVRPSALVAASLPALEPAPEEEPANGVEPEAPETPEPAQPEGYVFRGFTLYERTQKGKTIRFFSKKSPVGGGQPALLPDGYDVRWDNKERRPVLVPPKAPEPMVEVAEPEPTPSKTPLVAPKAPAPEPMELPTPTAKPCSAMTSPGVFCESPAKEGGLYCSRHLGYKAEVTQVEVARDGVGKKGKAPKFALPSFEIRHDRGASKPLKAKKPRTVELSVKVDRAAPKPKKAPKARAVELVVREAKTHAMPQVRPKEAELDVRADRPKKAWTRPVRPRVVEVEIRKAEAHELPQTRAREGPLDIRVAKAHPLPKTRAREGPVEVRAAKAHELPKTRAREGSVEVRAARAHDLPKLKAHEPKLEVHNDRGGRKAAKPLKLNTGEIEIHADKVHMKPMQLKSAYDATKAEVITAKGMPAGRKAGKARQRSPKP